MGTLFGALLRRGGRSVKDRQEDLAMAAGFQSVAEWQAHARANSPRPTVAGTVRRLLFATVVLAVLCSWLGGWALWLAPFVLVIALEPWIACLDRPLKGGKR